MAAWIGGQLGAKPQRQSAVRAAVAQQIRAAFTVGIIPEEAPLGQVIESREVMHSSERCAVQTHYAQLLVVGSGLLLPELHFVTALQSRTWWHRLFNLPMTTPRANSAAHTLTDLIDWTVALNCKQLLILPFQSQYGVEQAIIGITSESTGLEVSEIKLSSSFTNDLGMD